MHESDQKKAQSIYKIIMLAILVAFITFMVTSLSLYTYFTKNSVYTLLEGKTNTNSLDITNSLDGIKSLIDKNYLWKNKIDEQKLKDGAIAGYVEGLGDKYTEYISKEDMKEFTEDITGNFVGIGIYMTADEETRKIVVYYPIPDSPAEKAGIKSGDIIVSVDGVEYDYDDFSIISDHIKGEEATKVKIVVERDGKQLEFEISRSKIETNPIIAKVIEKNIGYVRLPSFDSNCADRFKEKVDELLSNGAKSLIIDLRNNTGGILDECTKIADYFLDKEKIIMITKDNNEKEEQMLSENKPIYKLPVIIITNENTASASEILTSALKDNKRAKIIGTKTYGKGVIQTVINLPDGSGLKITTAEYFTLNGTAINEIGITPDIEVKLPDTVKNIYAVNEKDDTQLKRAIEEF